VKVGSNANQQGGRELRDTTQIDITKPLQIAYIGPSITPLTGLNAGYRVYQVDPRTFSIVGAQTYYANMSNSLQWTRPIWEFEYDTREAYSLSSDAGEETHNAEEATRTELGISWPASAPLNATFWHLVTEKMLNSSDYATEPPTKSELLKLYELYEAKSSTHPDRRASGGSQSPEQKICFLRAGSGYLGRYCRQKYGGDARSARERRFNAR
jgi:sphingomyelin phosphodiesterase